MSRDVTAEVLKDSAFGLGEHRARVARAKPAKELTPSLTATLASVLARSDRTMGNLSSVLAYSRSLPASKSERSNLFRLLKGGHLRVLRVEGKPPPGSNAKFETPHALRYYVLEGPA